MTRFLFPALAAACIFAIPSVGAAEEAPESTSVRDLPIGARFENGIAAIVEDRVITVGDIRRRMADVIGSIIQSAGRDRQKLERLLREVEDEVIQNLVDDVLIVKDFYSDEKRKIPDKYVDSTVKDRLIEDFDNDRSKFLAYLREIGKTHLEYRELVREEMIVGYMKQQKRKTETMISPLQIENYYTENRDKFFQDDAVHLRMIQLSAIAGESEAVLQQTADTIMAELRAGKDFGALAKQYSQGRAKDNGGDQGWLNKSDMAEDLVGPAFALEAGQYSEPIKLGSAIMILFVEEKRAAGIMPIDDVREQIETMLVTQLGRDAIERWIERLRRAAYVRYFN